MTEQLFMTNNAGQKESCNFNKMHEVIAWPEEGLSNIHASLIFRSPLLDKVFGTVICVYVCLLLVLLLDLHNRWRGAFTLKSVSFLALCLVHPHNKSPPFSTT